jgi:vacuolar-type H+-ATPase subunit F/Vma7
LIKPTVSSITIPWEIAAPIGISVTAIVTALWAKLRQKEAEIKELNQSIIREIRRSTQLALSPASEEVPSPDWDEKTDMHDLRKLIERQVKADLDSRLKAYMANESTPPNLRRLR